MSFPARRERRGCLGAAAGDCCGEAKPADTRSMESRLFRVLLLLSVFALCACAGGALWIYMAVEEFLGVLVVGVAEGVF